MYDNFEIKRMLESMVILYDTREQDTASLRRRLGGFNCPSKRFKLDYGDYSAEYINLQGQTISMANKVVIERKMNLDELCTCYTKSRERFKREFERAKIDGARVYLLVENDNFEKLFNGKYRSRLQPNSLIASFLAWSIRYNIHLHFCKEATTPQLIYKILYYELKEFLENMRC